MPSTFLQWERDVVGYVILLYFIIILFFEMSGGSRPPVSFPPGETQAQNLAGRPREQSPLVTEEPTYPGPPGTVVVLKLSLGFQETHPWVH